MKQNLANLAVSAASGLIGGSVVAAATFVELQGSTPGTAQTGHLNITGRALAGGGVGVGTNPNTARVQVKETGTAQGVRADTNSGVAVYGATTATTGSAPGGYFTNKSAGGAAVVGDAQSLTGSTIGGLFYNRSANGIGISGRQLKTDGTGAAVQGTAASPNGTGVRAVNASTGDSAELAGPNGAIMAKGDGIYNEYVSGSRRPAIPIAYGVVSSSGNIFNAGSGNWTVTRPSTGVFQIDVQGVSLSESQYSAIYSPNTASGQPRILCRQQGGGDLEIRCYTLAGALDNTVGIHFAIFGNSFPPVTGMSPQRDVRSVFDNSTLDHEKDPAAARWLAEQRRKHEELGRIFPVEIPE